MSPLILLLSGFSPIAGSYVFEANESDSLKGQFLVASSRISDPRFRETVILLAEHDENGALGLVVNKRAKQARLSEFMEGLALPPPPRDTEFFIHYGGPVQLNHVFVLHSTEFLPDSSKEVSPGVALSTDPTLLSRIGRGEGPEKWRLFIGYSGWAAGQLEAELNTGSWIIVDAEEPMVFSEDPDETWNRIIKAHTFRL